MKKLMMLIAASFVFAACGAKTQNTVPTESTTPSNAVETISQEKAVDLVSQYLKDNNMTVPANVVVDSEDDNQFIVRCSESTDANDSTATLYTVDKTTGNVQPMTAETASPSVTTSPQEIPAE